MPWKITETHNNQGQREIKFKFESTTEDLLALKKPITEINIIENIDGMNNTALHLNMEPPTAGQFRNYVIPALAEIFGRGAHHTIGTTPSFYQIRAIVNTDDRRLLANYMLILQKLCEDFDDIKGRLQGELKIEDSHTPYQKIPLWVSGGVKKSQNMFAVSYQNTRENSLIRNIDLTQYTSGLITIDIYADDTGTLNKVIAYLPFPSHDLKDMSFKMESSPRKHYQIQIKDLTPTVIQILQSIGMMTNIPYMYSMSQRLVDQMKQWNTPASEAQETNSNVVRFSTVPRPSLITAPLPDAYNIPFKVDGDYLMFFVQPGAGHDFYAGREDEWKLMGLSGCTAEMEACVKAEKELAAQGIVTRIVSTMSLENEMVAKQKRKFITPSNDQFDVACDPYGCYEYYGCEPRFFLSNKEEPFEYNACQRREPVIPRVYTPHIVILKKINYYADTGLWVGAKIGMLRRQDKNTPVDLVEAAIAIVKNDRAQHSNVNMPRSNNNSAGNN